MRYFNFFIFLFLSIFVVYADCSGDENQICNAQDFSALPNPTITQFNTLDDSQKDLFFQDSANLDKCASCREEYYGDASNIGKNPQTDDIYFSKTDLSTHIESSNQYLKNKFNNQDVNFALASGTSFSDNPPTLKVGSNVLKLTVGSSQGQIPYGTKTISYDSNINAFVFEPTKISLISSESIVNSDGSITLPSGGKIDISGSVLNLDAGSKIKFTQDGIVVEGKTNGKYNGVDFENYDGKLIVNQNFIQSDNAKIKYGNSILFGNIEATFLNSRFNNVKLLSDKSSYYDNSRRVKGKAQIDFFQNGNWNRVVLESKTRVEFGEVLDKNYKDLNYLVEGKSEIIFDDKKKLSKVALLERDSSFLDKKSELRVNSNNFETLFQTSVTEKLEFSKTFVKNAFREKTIYFTSSALEDSQNIISKLNPLTQSVVFIDNVNNKINSYGSDIEIEKNGDKYFMLRDGTSFEGKFDSNNNEVNFKNKELEIKNSDVLSYAYIQKKALVLNLENSKDSKEIFVDYIVSQNKNGDGLFLDVNSMLKGIKSYVKPEYYVLKNDMTINLDSNTITTDYSQRVTFYKNGANIVVTDNEKANLILGQKIDKLPSLDNDIRFRAYQASALLLSNKEMEIWDEVFAEHKDEAITVDTFLKRISGNDGFIPWNVLENTVEKEGSENFEGDIEGIRYVKHPVDPNIVIDMNHFIKIGSISSVTNVVGDSIEALQYVSEFESSDTKWNDAKSLLSAGNPQDYYSNRLGSCYFRKYHNPFKSLDLQLKSFFEEGYKTCESLY